ncbi:MAG: hypothetical protein ABIF77_07480, partial [bacterium]
TRPFAIVCEPPDAAPGETVTVTLHCYEPQPSAGEVSWMLVLDYNEDLYGEQAVERRIIDLDQLATIDDMVYDNEGLGTLTFEFVVPQNTLLVTSALEDRFTEPLPDAVRQLFQPAHADYLTRAEIDGFLARVDPAALDPESLAWVQSVSDRFACQIRLRASLRSGIDLTVTKNLTVRYSSRLGSDNVNQNPTVNWVAVLAVHHSDLEDPDDIGRYVVDTTYVYHRDPARQDTTPIAVDRNLTYYLQVDHDPVPYLSPLGNLQTEDHDYNWYFARLYSSNSDRNFYLNETGDDKPDIGELEEIVRFDPPPGPDAKQVRVFVVVRDYRLEWYQYNFVPGAAYVTVPVAFTFP